MYCLSKWDKIPFNEMWEEDKYWFPIILLIPDAEFNMFCQYDGRKLNDVLIQPIRKA